MSERIEESFVLDACIILVIVALIIVVVIGALSGPPPKPPEPCPPAVATHIMFCVYSDRAIKLPVYYNGGYVCTDSGGRVKAGENCTMIPIRASVIEDQF